MNTALKSGLIIVAVLAVAGGLFFAGQAYGRQQSAGVQGFWGPAMMGGYGWDHHRGQTGYGPMMGGRGGYGPMMGNGYGYEPAYATTAQPLTVEEARQAGQAYLDRLNLGGLSLGEVMIFQENAYVIVKEDSTGLGAFELLVDPVSKAAYPEHGPNVMWNVKYGGLNHQGMMGGRGAGWMMGGWASATPADVSSEMPVTADAAVQAAQTYLDQVLPGATAADDPTQFYGYYTLDYSKDGKIVGMLSVNGFNSQIFVHTWHGTFIEEVE
jgi:hypothetical protein